MKARSFASFSATSVVVGDIFARSVSFVRSCVRNRCVGGDSSPRGSSPPLCKCPVAAVRFSLTLLLFLFALPLYFSLPRHVYVFDDEEDESSSRFWNVREALRTLSKALGACDSISRSLLIASGWQEDPITFPSVDESHDAWMKWRVEKLRHTVDRARKGPIAPFVLSVAPVVVSEESFDDDSCADRSVNSIAPSLVEDDSALAPTREDDRRPPRVLLRSEGPIIPPPLNLRRKYYKPSAVLLGRKKLEDVLPKLSIGFKWPAASSSIADTKTEVVPPLEDDSDSVVSVTANSVSDASSLVDNDNALDPTSEGDLLEDYDDDIEPMNPEQQRDFDEQVARFRRQVGEASAGDEDFLPVDDSDDANDEAVESSDATEDLEGDGQEDEIPSSSMIEVVPQLRRSPRLAALVASRLEATRLKNELAQAATALGLVTIAGRRRSARLFSTTFQG